ncbi:DUF2268 domain-containing protein [Metabacillus litoralis]|uniref:DUF2268 domain-containing protein n=1 Tax=Metabacillus litoralis TaxID=152268 RepID=UPI001CFE3038|nr:DUF2268 domain-containing protein [Metabacillus litoralis]
MSVIDTVEWLKKATTNQDIYKKLERYFTNMKEDEIAKYLQTFGMYQRSTYLEEWVERIENDQILKYVKRLESMLKEEWGGPDVPIFTFPCEQNNRKIQIEYDGRSGLAFHNKLFLFLSQDVKKNHIKSLFIHEYHHVCRLAVVSKKEKSFTIIDTMIMEGLAENAVREKLGEDSVASWTKRYTEMQCQRFLDRIILPNKEVTRENPKFSQLMFGTGLYPSMLGYSVGYYLVKKYMENSSKKTKQLLAVDAEVFL